jgi:hypothetical protein
LRDNLLNTVQDQRLGGVKQHLILIRVKLAYGKATSGDKRKRVLAWQDTQGCDFPIEKRRRAGRLASFHQGFKLNERLRKEKIVVMQGLRDGKRRVNFPALVSWDGLSYFFSTHHHTHQAKPK